MPTAHGLHEDAYVLTGRYWPGAQKVHVLAGGDEYAPWAQSEHWVEAVFGAYLPAPHGTHMLDEGLPVVYE